DVSSIVASPVIAGGLAIATGLAGTTVAFDLRSGRRIWSIGAGGGETPAIAGDWLFLLTEGQRLAAIRVADGVVGWVTDLPAYGNPARRRQPLTWHGPLVAGAGLLLTGSDRRMIVVDAVTGRLLTTPDQGLALNGEADLAPIAAAGTLFALTRNAVLTAYR
ncbi:MAG: pyrrolo-quinoline quinone, partial [Acidiphilium sp. 37-67-22]